MDVKVSAIGKRVDIAPQFGGFHAHLAQMLGADGMDAELQLHVGGDTIRLDVTDDQVLALGRAIDCYIEGTYGRGRNLWSCLQPIYADRGDGESGPMLAVDGFCGLRPGHEGHHAEIDVPQEAGL